MKHIIAKHLIIITSFLLITPMAISAKLADKGDTIVFYGDSITQFGTQPKGYVTLLKQSLERHGITVHGAGVAGRKINGLHQQLNAEVLSKSPDLVIVYIGINDIWHWDQLYRKQNMRGSTPDEYRAGIDYLVAKLKAQGIDVALCTPTVIGEKREGQNPHDEAIRRYSEIIREVGALNKIPVIDLQAEFRREIADRNPENEERGILTGDGVHLNDEGNQFLAETLSSAIHWQKH